MVYAFSDKDLTEEAQKEIRIQLDFNDPIQLELSGHELDIVWEAYPNLCADPAKYPVQSYFGEMARMIITTCFLGDTVLIS